MSRGEERGPSGSDVPGCASGSGSGEWMEERERGGKKDEHIERGKRQQYGRWADRDEMNERAYLHARVRQRGSERVKK